MLNLSIMRDIINHPTVIFDTRLWDKFRSNIKDAIILTYVEL